MKPKLPPEPDLLGDALEENRKLRHSLESLAEAARWAERVWRKSPSPVGGDGLMVEAMHELRRRVLTRNRGLKKS